MPRVHLCPAFVKSATCPEGMKKVDFFDSEQRGFMLEVRRSGGKTYYQRYTDDRGRERQFKIGPADVLSLVGRATQGADRSAAEALVGTDPQDRRAEMRTIPTLAELVRDRYLPHVKSYKRSWCTDETVLRVHILPVLGAQYVDLIRGRADRGAGRTDARARATPPAPPTASSSCCAISSTWRASGGCRASRKIRRPGSISRRT